jgi:hypothetical protein
MPARAALMNRIAFVGHPILIQSILVAGVAMVNGRSDAWVSPGLGS